MCTPILALMNVKYSQWNKEDIFGTIDLIHILKLDITQTFSTYTTRTGAKFFLISTEFMRIELGNTQKQGYSIQFTHVDQITILLKHAPKIEYFGPCKQIVPKTKIHSLQTHWIKPFRKAPILQLYSITHACNPYSKNRVQHISSSTQIDSTF